MRRLECPLWVKRRHVRRKKSCPLYSESDIRAYDSRPTGSDQSCQKTRDAWCMAKMHSEELIACRRSDEPQHPLSYLCAAPTYSFVSLRMLERYLRMLVRPPSRALAFPCLEHAGSRFLSRRLRVVMVPGTLELNMTQRTPRNVSPAFIVCVGRIAALESHSVPS
jgi:hypothetical protein